jgi:uncharacterized protein
MKIIDTHTHLPGLSFGCGNRPIADVRKELESVGLCGSWLMTTDGLLKEPEKNNTILAQAVAKHLDFFIPFCTVSPNDGVESCLKELKRAKFELGMKGLKLHPWLQSFSLTNPEVLPVLEKAGEYNMPVLFHDGSPPYSATLQIAWAAENCPETVIILGHSGLDYLYKDAILASKSLPNIYLCLCSLSAGYIKEIVNKCDINRILFGSDGGFSPGITDLAIDKVKSTGLDEESLEKIFYKNPRRLIPSVF